MGKLGGREMTATSDLDLILVYDFDGEHPESDGKRTLYGAQYFARLTQRLINALTAQTNYGALYEVDMRLRPSGQAGPAGDADRQLHQLSGKRGLDLGAYGADARAGGVGVAGIRRAGAGDVIQDILRRPRDAEQIAGDVVEMRAAIAKEKGDGNPWDLKYAAGGLVDLEFIAQYLQLVHAHRLPDILDTSTARVLDKARQLQLVSVEDAEVLRPAAQLYHDLTQILRLCLAGPFDAKTAGRRPAAAAGARRRRAGFRHAQCDAWSRRKPRCGASFVRILGKAP